MPLSLEKLNFYDFDKNESEIENVMSNITPTSTYKRELQFNHIIENKTCER